MVGNDVVDLDDRDADPATLSPRFDERVFATEELASLSRRDDAEAARRRWRLWAAKEAAYKVAVKMDAGIVFSPSRFRVELDDEGDGSESADGFVTCEAGRLPVSVTEKGGAVHAIARSPGSGWPREPRLILGVLRVGAETSPADSAGGGWDPGSAVRAFSRARLAAELAVDPAALEIRRRGRVPELWQGGVRSDADLSLSHHGGVVAFACEIATGAARLEELR